jgi:uncharacterized protein
MRREHNMVKNKTQVVIIHGSYGHPGENWFPWLANEVRKLGHKAGVPTFPTPEGQNLNNWRSSFREQIGNVTRDMILVGHSLGSGFIFSLLEESDMPVKGTFLASGFLGKLGLEEFDLINESFVCREFNWKRIRENAGKVYIYNSDNDPYVPLVKGEELAEKLGVRLTVIKNGGHINASAGFRTFPRLLEDLRPLLNS